MIPNNNLKNVHFIPTSKIFKKTLKHQTVLNIYYGNKNLYKIKQYLNYIKNKKICVWNKIISTIHNSYLQLLKHYYYLIYIYVCNMGHF